MDGPKSHNLFQVFLRLRPPQAGVPAADRFLAVEPPATDAPSTAPTHIQLNPPNDRRRAIEKFCFTQVFEEDASQLDVFHCAGVVPLVEGVLAPHGGEGTDALLATLGVTGSGKSHTILGSRSQRGLTQLALDVIFRSIGSNMADSTDASSLEASISASDASEATIYAAQAFLETVYADMAGPSRYSSRAPTPMIGEHSTPGGAPPPQTGRRLMTRPAGFPQQPAVDAIHVSSDAGAEYAVLVSMYEVYNDRIFDLLTPAVKSATTKEYRRRPLLFKSTETSPDRKVVAGLRKIVCTDVQQALLVLEAGLHERRVAGTGSNSVSSRSHGFVCVEVKKRTNKRGAAASAWTGSTLSIVDLAGSERARDAKTAGATLAEAGKINESLMYLGQCLQMQSDAGSSSKVVPFRQCKLTELLFSNSFPSSHFGQSVRRNPQKAVMIVTADPHGDFNATSQILRYSALAREITVPRIPSITQTILASSAQAAAAASASAPEQQTPASTTAHHRPFFPPGSSGSGTHHHGTGRTFSPCSTGSDERITMEIAALEIARMSEEIDYLRASLEEEAEKRLQAESHLLTLTDRLLDLEQEVREECAVAFEQQLAIEMARWKASLDAEKERCEAHWDRKVEVMERLQTDTPDAVDAAGGNTPLEDKENVLVENLEEENARLRREILVMKRELVGRSPVKRKPLRERDDLPMAAAASPAPSAVSTPDRPKTNKSGRSRKASRPAAAESLRQKMERLRVADDDGDISSLADDDSYYHNNDSDAAAAIMSRPSSNTSLKSAAAAGHSTSPKKMRKLSPRKWDVALDEDDLF